MKRNFFMTVSLWLKKIYEYLKMNIDKYLNLYMKSKSILLDETG